jgi:uncharacterized protein YkwD
MNIAQRLGHLFFPRESNNHKAKFLHSSSIITLSFLLLISQVFIQFGEKSSKVLGYAANISPDEVIRLTNEKRAQNGVGPVEYNSVLSQAAAAKGADMLAKGYWAHVAPDGTQPWHFFLTFGYKYKYAGENLARDFTNASSAVDAWMASPSHRENMLNGNYKDIGVAVVEGNLSGADTTIIVQFFGSKLADTIPIAPVAAAETRSIAKATESPVPNHSPTPTPTATPVVASVETPAPTPQPLALVSPFNATKSLSLVLVVILLIALVVDYLHVTRKNIRRIGGRSLAHLAFFGMVAVVLLIAKVGNII